MSEQTQQAQTAPIAPEQPRRFELLEMVLQAGENRQDYARGILDIEVQRGQAAEDWKLAKLFYQAGCFADLKGKNPEEGMATAFAKIQLGRSWSMNAGDAVQFIYFDKNGRPQVMSEYLAARMKRAGYNWSIEWLGPPEKCAGCVLWPTKAGEDIEDRDGNPVSVTFTEADAKAAKLLDKDGAWKTYSQDMYFWRAIVRLKRRYAPEVLTGAGVQELAEEFESEQQAGSVEAQQAVLARKLAEVAEFDAKRVKKQEPVGKVDAKPTAEEGEFFQ